MGGAMGFNCMVVADYTTKFIFQISQNWFPVPSVVLTVTTELTLSHSRIYQLQIVLNEMSEAKSIEFLGT